MSHLYCNEMLIFNLWSQVKCAESQLEAPCGLDEVCECTHKAVSLQRWWSPDIWKRPAQSYYQHIQSSLLITITSQWWLILICWISKSTVQCIVEMPLLLLLLLLLSILAWCGQTSWIVRQSTNLSKKIRKNNKWNAPFQALHLMRELSSWVLILYFLLWKTFCQWPCWNEYG